MKADRGVRLVLLALTGAILCVPSMFAAEDAPDWVRRAAAQTVPSYPARVGTVVLFSEEMLTVNPDGLRVMRHREVVKLLQRGAELPAARRAYDTLTGRIRDFQAWMIPPAGKAVVYGKNQILDVALSRDYVYDEYRMKAVEFGGAPVGSVAAWDVTEEEKSVFTQDSNIFQGRAPALVSRFILNLPSGWEARAVIFNHEKFEPQVSGSTYTWELKDLPPIEREEYSPALDFLVPTLALSFFPPAGNPSGLQPLKDWAAVSAFQSQLADPSAEVTPAVRAKAMQLTAGASGELDKIRAIAAFAQQTNYVEIALNLTKGGGYTPHRADETLAKNYGDCKDKATLMRALLKAVGIDSYVTPIYSGERNFVRPEWPSPRQFNHMIIAVQVSPAIALPTVFEAPGLGRVMMFDPTDPFTPVGDLPESEQGSYALLLAGSRGALVQMPRLPATAKRIESSVDAEMDADGQLKARIARQYFGQSGSGLRAVSKLRGSDEVKKLYERTWTRRIAGSSLTSVATENHPEENRVAMNLDLKADQFGQIMQGRLLVIRPGILSSGNEFGFNTRQRSLPVELDSSLRKDTVRIKIPDGFKLDELPSPAKIESRYGTIEAIWKVQGGEVLFEQTLEVREFTAPVAEYASVRDFFDQVNGVLQAPVVLVKQ